MRNATKISIFGLVLGAATAVLAGEGRIPVYAPGTILSSPGKYVLTRNLVGTGATPVIRINSDVDLDLNGFTITGSGGVGIQTVNAGDVKISNGAIYLASVAIDIASASARRVELENLRIFATSSHGVSIDAQPLFVIRRVQVEQAVGDSIRVNAGTVVTGRIEDCQVFGGGGRGIYVYNGSSVAIVDNTVRSTGTEGIMLEGCLGCLVERNTVTQARGQGGIYLSFAIGSTVARNVASGNESHGIHLGSGARDILVEGNIMRENGNAITFGDGLRVAGTGNTIVGNTINGNQGMGLRFTSGATFSVYGRNVARGNSGQPGNTCSGVPTLSWPNSCNEGAIGLNSFGDNLIPGPPLN